MAFHFHTCECATFPPRFNTSHRLHIARKGFGVSYLAISGHDGPIKFFLYRSSDLHVKKFDLNWNQFNNLKKWKPLAVKLNACFFTYTNKTSQMNPTFTSDKIRHALPLKFLNPRRDYPLSWGEAMAFESRACALF